MKKKIGIISLIVLLLDQVSKFGLEKNLIINEKRTIIDNFFSLNLVHNTGASFSTLQNSKLLLIVISLLALILTVKYIKKFECRFWNILAFGMFIGGLLGNLIDRIFRGYVIDFLDFIIFKYDFPIFNLADTFIVLGVIMIMVSVLKGDGENEA